MPEFSEQAESGAVQLQDTGALLRSRSSVPGRLDRAAVYRRGIQTGGNTECQLADFKEIRIAVAVGVRKPQHIQGQRSRLHDLIEHRVVKTEVAAVVWLGGCRSEFAVGCSLKSDCAQVQSVNSGGVDCLLKTQRQTIEPRLRRLRAA